MVIVDDKIDNDISMFLRCWPFWWQWQSASAIRSASPNAACPGLLWKQLDAGIENYLLRIAPAATRATGKQTTNNKYTFKAGHFDGHSDVPVRNRAHRPTEEVQGLLEAIGCHHQASIMSNNIKGTWLRRFFMFFIIKTVGKGHGLMLRPLFLTA